MSDKGFNFIEYGPINPPAKKLVFVLHGYGRNATTMSVCAKEIAAQIPDAKIILPDGPEMLNIPKKSGTMVLPVPQILKKPDKTIDPKSLRQWFSLEGDWDDVKNSIARVAPHLNKFIDNHRDILGVQDKDIAILGFSQGGGVGLYAAYARKNPIACFVAHSTVFMNDNSLVSKPPTLFVYGDKDEEFTQTQYSQIMGQLKSYLGGLESKKIPGLMHKTNSESRKNSAEFIKRHLSP